jgi:hypothetical protein
MLITNSFFSQKLVKHSCSKDQFLRVTIKRLTETQLFKDEMKEMSELNSVLLAHNRELEAQLVYGSREKSGTYSVDFP